MVVTHKLNMDLAGGEPVRTLAAVQGDINTRCIRVCLFSNKAPWKIPEGTTVLVRYRKEDGSHGCYDTLSDGSAAWAIKDNELTVFLAPQVLDSAGMVMVYAQLLSDGKVLNTFAMQVQIQSCDGVMYGTSPDAQDRHVYLTGVMPAPESARSGQYLRVLSVDSSGKVMQVEAVDEVGEDQIDAQEVERIIEAYLASHPSMDGEDGISPVVNILPAETGVTIEITDAAGTHTAYIEHGRDGEQGPKGNTGEQGPKGDTGEQGPAGEAGPAGEPGHTPVRGVDFWTEADRAAIIQEVVETIGGAVIGYVDDQKNIRITGELSDGTYVLKYENQDGTTTEIGTLVIGPVDESGLIAIVWAGGVKLDKNTGAEGEGANYGASQSISYDSGYSYTLSTKNDYHVSATICWYDASGNYLGWNDALASGADPGGEASAVLTPLAGSASFRIRAYTIHADEENRTGALKNVSLRKDLL